MLHQLDGSIRALVRLSAAIAGGTESVVRAEMEVCVAGADHQLVEEIILQSYLFAGFPRALNAARAWRAASGRLAPDEDPRSRGGMTEWRHQGERTCAIVYGDAYDRLRDNIRALHPLLDDWMIVEGYGKVLSRPQLDLKTRELAIVAACAGARQQRQLHSHLHGALNSGATAAELDATLRALSDLLPPIAIDNYRQLLRKVVKSRGEPAVT
jgi:4-carboxymuconolactone decarboxylase